MWYAQLPALFVLAIKECWSVQTLHGTDWEEGAVRGWSGFPLFPPYTFWESFPPAALYHRSHWFSFRDGLLFQLKSAGVQLVILPFGGDEFLVAAPLDDAAMVQHQDDVGVLHRGQPVGNDKGGATVPQ